MKKESPLMEKKSLDDKSHNNQDKKVNEIKWHDERIKMAKGFDFFFIIFYKTDGIFFLGNWSQCIEEGSIQCEIKMY